MTSVQRGPLEKAVHYALLRHSPEPRDKGTAELARVYAREIDTDGDVVKLGPLLLACLEAMHMSPRARAVVKGVVQNENKPVNRLDQLAERRARKSRAEDLHTITTE